MLPLHADSGQARRELRQLLSTGEKVDDAKVNKIIDRLLDNRAKLAQLDQARLKEARKVLTAVQAAKLVVVLPQVEREVEKKIRKALRQGGKAGAADDDDE